MALLMVDEVKKVKDYKTHSGLVHQGFGKKIKISRNARALRNMNTSDSSHRLLSLQSRASTVQDTYVQTLKRNGFLE